MLAATDAPALDELLAALPDEGGAATTVAGTGRNVREQLAALSPRQGQGPTSAFPTDRRTPVLSW